MLHALEQGTTPNMTADTMPGPTNLIPDNDVAIEIPKPKEPAPGATLRDLKAGMKTVDKLTQLAFHDREPTELTEEAIAALHRLASYIHYSVTSVYQWRNEREDPETGEIITSFT